MNTIKTNTPIESVPYGETVIPQNRLEFLTQKCREVLQKVPGNVLEIGVYKGGTIIGLAKQVQDVCPSCKVYGVDTFSGHPYTDGHPVHPEGKYADVSREELEETFKQEGLAIQLYKGKIEEIFDSLNLENVSFVHVDCDLYIPIKFCAEKITPVINKGGMIYFDDYGHEHCPGATKAVDEVFSKDQIHEVSLEDGTCWSCYIHV